ncbi:MAG: hypothetical protein ACRDYZ_00995 [Acidimicrobiales bacterium]
MGPGVVAPDAGFDGDASGGPAVVGEAEAGAGGADVAPACGVVAGEGWTTTLGGAVTTVTVAAARTGAAGGVREGDGVVTGTIGSAAGTGRPLVPWEAPDGSSVMTPGRRSTAPGKAMPTPPPSVRATPTTTAAPIPAAVQTAHRSRSGTRLRRLSERTPKARRSAFPPRGLPITHHSAAIGVVVRVAAPRCPAGRA